MSKATIIAMSNQKGGVGKTTSTINLGASIAVQEKKVLLVDLDPQANTSSGVGVTAGQEHLLYDGLIGQSSAEQIIKKTDTPFLDVMPTTPDLIGFEIEAVDLPEREYQLKKLLQQVSEQYDYILIDCPPSLGLLTVNALSCADQVIVPLQAEYYALEGLSRLVQTIDLVRENLNAKLRLEGILLTMFDKRNSLCHQVELEVKNHFGRILYRTKIPRNVRVSEAPSFGKPILMYDIRSSGAQNYLALAKEFFDRQKQKQQAPLQELQTNSEPANIERL
ncbi:MAG: ParA family protein [Bdellovibrionales bacterium]|nr:ParA family protein [Bdellovibrionales bacterium]